jgi:hypothetical protein
VPSPSLAGRLYWVVDGVQQTAMDTTTGGIYVQPKVFPTSLTVGSHPAAIYYCPAAYGSSAISSGKSPCPSSFNAATYYGNAYSNGHWMKLDRTIQVAVAPSQIVIALSRKVVSLADLQSGAKTVDVYAYATAPGVVESTITGMMQLYINGIQVGSAVATKMLPIPGSSTKKPAIQVTLDKTKLPAVGSYQLTIVFEPTGVTADVAGIVTSSARTIQVSR